MNISQETIQEILNYLGTKPYIEVAQLIAKLMKEVQEQQQQTNQEGK